jgi:hypothetical protein
LQVRFVGVDPVQGVALAKLTRTRPA